MDMSLRRVNSFPRRSPRDAVTDLLDALKKMVEYDDADTDAPALKANADRAVSSMKAFIYGDETLVTSAGGGGSSASSSAAVDAETRAALINELAEAVKETEVFPLFFEQIKSVDFETRKSMASIFVYLLRNNTQNFASEYMPRSSLVSVHSRSE